MAQILVIDDDPTIQLLLKRTLVKHNYEVILASNGQEGFTKAIEYQPALIVCDWLMPEISGLQVCRQVKETPALSTTFFILLTALGTVEDRVKGLDAGADDFLCKPIEMPELLARVRAGLRLHQLSKDLQQQKKLLEDELTEAADYVCSILPEPLEHPNVTIDSCFIPSRQLGGDSFDFYWLDDDHLVMYLLDVSGHGLRASLPSLSVLNLLRSRGLSQVNYYQPNAVLKGLNEVFKMTQRNDKYFTIWYGVYQATTRTLTYSSAGHPPALLCQYSSDAVPQPLKTFGFPIGMFTEATYHNESCFIPPNSYLYVFSDGIYEIPNETGDIWGLEAFTHVIQTHCQLSQPTLENLLEELPLNPTLEELGDDLSLIKIIFR